MKFLFFNLLLFSLFFSDSSYSWYMSFNQGLSSLFTCEKTKDKDSWESYFRKKPLPIGRLKKADDSSQTEKEETFTKEKEAIQKFHERLIKATKEKDKDTLFKMFKIPFSVSLGLGRGLGIKNREDFNKHFDFIFNDKVCKAIIDSTPYSFWEHGTWGMCLNLGREKFWFDGYENNDSQHFSDYNLEEEKTNQEGKKILVKTEMCFLIDVINSGPPKYEEGSNENLNLHRHAGG